MAESPIKTKEKTDLTPAEAELKAMSIAERRQHIGQILSRGLVNHRLEVKDADPNRRYVWIRERDEDIDKFRALGYRVETERGGGEHGTGDDRRRVGDVILMSTSRENYELIREVERERTEAKLKAGKREYLDKARQHDVPIFNDEEA